MQNHQINQLLKGKFLLGINKDDIENLQKVSEEIELLRYDKAQIKKRDLFANKLAKSKGVIVVFEQQNDILEDEYKEFIEYIQDAVGDEVSVMFDLKIVDIKPKQPIVVLFGFDNNKAS